MEKSSLPILTLGEAIMLLWSLLSCWDGNKDHLASPESTFLGPRCSSGLIHPVLENVSSCPCGSAFSQRQCLEEEAWTGSSQLVLIHQSRTICVGWGDLVLVKQKDIPCLGQGHLPPRVLMQNHWYWLDTDSILVLEKEEDKWGRVSLSVLLVPRKPPGAGILVHFEVRGRLRLSPKGD